MLPIIRHKDNSGKGVMNCLDMDREAFSKKENSELSFFNIDLFVAK